jgi:TolB protein
MTWKHISRWLVVLSLTAALFAARNSAAQETDLTPVGFFDSHGDVGTVLYPGSTTYDAATKNYTLAGSGENMWFATDAFQFAWKKVSGDISIGADIAFVGQGGNPHRKAVLIFRQTLDPDSPYVDVALHGVGMTALQYRDAKGERTHDIEIDPPAPSRLLLEKRGDEFVLYLTRGDGQLAAAGASIHVPIGGTYYVGIGVCSHDANVVERAVFSNVALAADVARGDQTKLLSTLETIAIDSTDRRIVYVAPGHFEAPNWTPDGKTLLFNRDGHIERLPVAGGKPEVIDTDFATRCNNDHGISPDGKWLAISDQSQGDQRSRVYILPIEGGTPRLITPTSPSYWHGWSPDGKTLAFVGERNHEFDIYSISTSGGEESRLTSAKGLDDGPEYSPDGKYIYFNSERTGSMQLWRMHPDGSDQVQITSDEFNNWFPHISPDGKWMVYLTYEKGVTGHPANKDVMLRLMSLSDKKVTVLAKLFGGQGTINVPSWSPDSLHLAFVSYELLSDQTSPPKN